MWTLLSGKCFFGILREKKWKNKKGSWHFSLTFVQETADCRQWVINANNKCNLKGRMKILWGLYGIKKRCGRQLNRWMKCWWKIINCNCRRKKCPILRQWRCSICVNWLYQRIQGLPILRSQEYCCLQLLLLAWLLIAFDNLISSCWSQKRKSLCGNLSLVQCTCWT